MAGKRTRERRGYGSVWQEPDGRFRGGISLGIGLGGKRVRRYTRRYDTEDEALDALDALIDALNAGELAEPNKMTVPELLDSWLAAKRPDIKATTYEGYESMVRVHLKPHFQAKRVQAVTTQELRLMFAAFHERGMSGRMRQIAHQVLRQAFRTAVEWDVIKRSPMDGVPRPRVPKPKPVPFTLEEMHRVLAAAEGDELEAFWWIAFQTGLRLGEILGLQWSVINLRTGEVHLTSQITRLQGRDGLRRSTLKHEGQARIVVFPRMTMRKLRRHYGRLRRSGYTGDLVFPSRAGTPMHPNNIRKRHWYPLLKKAGVPRRRIHDARHTIATLLLDEGENVINVQNMLGHARSSFTLDLYGHRTAAGPRRAAQTVDRLFENHT